MKNSPYKVDNGSSKFLSTLGSGVVAVGSVATAIVVVVPGMPGYELIASGIESTGVGIVPLSNPSVDGTSPIEGQASVLSSDSNSVSVGPASTTTSLFPSPNSEVSDPSAAPKSPLAAAPAPTPSGSEPGNTSSPTPGGGTWADGGSSSGGGSGNTTSPTPSSGSNAGNGSGSGNESGNTTSPTPGGGDYEDDDDDHDEDDD